MCLAWLRLAIATPTFVGQAPGHASNYEIVRRIRHPDGEAMLVAIGIERDQRGAYWVRTSYQ